MGNINFGTYSYKMIVSDGLSQNFIAVNKNNSQLLFQIQANARITIYSDILSQNVWYHIVGTYDGIKMRIYVNGVEKGSDNLSGNIAASSMNIGWGQDDRFWKGIIDEVRIYNRALSASEILERYNAGI